MEWKEYLTLFQEDIYVRLITSAFLKFEFNKSNRYMMHVDNIHCGMFNNKANISLLLVIYFCFRTITLKNIACELPFLFMPHFATYTVHWSGSPLVIGVHQRLLFSKWTFSSTEKSSPFLNPSLSLSRFFFFLCLHILWFGYSSFSVFLSDFFEETHILYPLVFLNKWGNSEVFFVVKGFSISIYTFFFPLLFKAICFMIFFV
eukprot:gene9355-6578_t